MSLWARIPAPLADRAVRRRGEPRAEAWASQEEPQRFGCLVLWPLGPGAWPSSLSPLSSPPPKREGVGAEAGSPFKTWLSFRSRLLAWGGGGVGWAPGCPPWPLSPHKGDRDPSCVSPENLTPAPVRHGRCRRRLLLSWASDQRGLVSVQGVCAAQLSSFHSLQAPPGWGCTWVVTGHSTALGRGDPRAQPPEPGSAEARHTLGGAPI